jgi:hypothetical protein
MRTRGRHSAHSKRASASAKRACTSLSSAYNPGRARSQMSSFLILILRKVLSVCPELTNGHVKIVTDRSHYVTRSVRETALYPSPIIGTIAQRCR